MILTKEQLCALIRRHCDASRRVHFDEMNEHKARQLCQKIDALDKEGAKVIDEVIRAMTNAISFLKTSKKPYNFNNDSPSTSKNVAKMKVDIGKLLQKLGAIAAKAENLWDQFSDAAADNEELWDVADAFNFNP